jgi:predicted dehydrogenase
MDKIRVGVIGCGYWGPNLIRNISGCPSTEAVALYDACPARLEAMGRAYNHLQLAGSLEQLLEQPIQAVAIATPVSTHFSPAERRLEAGLHVLVEKPMASTVHEARVLIDLASRQQQVLMVDHT